jgi:hypothetical protein
VGRYGEHQWIGAGDGRWLMKGGGTTMAGTVAGGKAESTLQRVVAIGDKMIFGEAVEAVTHQAPLKPAIRHWQPRHVGGRCRPLEMLVNRASGRAWPALRQLFLPSNPAAYLLPFMD